MLDSARNQLSSSKRLNKCFRGEDLSTLRVYHHDLDLTSECLSQSGFDQADLGLSAHLCFMLQIQSDFLKLGGTPPYPRKEWSRPIE